MSILFIHFEIYIMLKDIVQYRGVSIPSILSMFCNQKMYKFDIVISLKLIKNVIFSK